MHLALVTSDDVTYYLNKNRKILIPIGSTEQHGPTGLLGTDHLIPTALCHQIEELTGVMIAPCMNYGDSEHHMSFPGTITIKPSTLTLVVKDIIRSLSRQGFEQLYFINGHGGNVSAINCGIIESYTELNNSSLDIRLISWWLADKVRDYEKELFQNREGQHATCGEVSITMHLYRENNLVKSINQPTDSTRFKHPWPLSASQYKKTFPDGRMFSDLSLTNKEDGERLFNFTVDTLIKELNLHD